MRLYAAREAAYLAAREARRRAPEAPPAPVVPEIPRLGPYLAAHLGWKAARPHVRLGTLERDENSAKVLLRTLGNIPITEVTPARLEDYVTQRQAEPGCRRGTHTAARSIRTELHTLSHAMRRAVMLGLVPFNPVSRMMSKPPIPTEEAVYLTDAEAARLLAAAAEENREAIAQLAERQGQALAVPVVPGPARGPRADDRPAVTVDDQVTFAHAVLATHLYTGGRAEEVLGLEVRDVDLGAGRVHLRHNRWRRLKRDHHTRAVPLWPALREVLVAHLAALGLDRPGVAPDQLLFPSPVTGRMLYRFGKPLRRCLERAKLTEAHTGKRVTPHTLRHTYATALLQTLVPTADGGWAVRSSFDVAKMLGHRSSKLVDDTYGHAVDAPVYRQELRYSNAATASDLASPRLPLASERLNETPWSATQHAAAGHVARLGPVVSDASSVAVLLAAPESNGDTRSEVSSCQ